MPPCLYLNYIVCLALKLYQFQSAIRLRLKHFHIPSCSIAAGHIILMDIDSANSISADFYHPHNQYKTASLNCRYPSASS